jgi:hypothetical protein
MRICFKRGWQIKSIVLVVGALTLLGIISFGGYKTTRSAFDKIELGMTPQGVDDILGDGPDIVEGGSANFDAVWRRPTGDRVYVSFSVSPTSAVGTKKQRFFASFVT